MCSMEIQQYQNKLVIQPNALVNARYHLSMDEKKLVLMALSQIMAIDDPTIEQVAQSQYYDIDLKKLHQLSEEKIEYKEYARRMRATVRELFDRKIVLDSTKSVDWIRWITQIRWHLNQTTIQIKLSNEIMPLLVGIQSEFTACKLKNMILLRSPVSIRLYELLQQYEQFRTRTISVTELRDMFDLDGKYNRVNQFVTRLINPAIEDINKNTNMKIEELQRHHFLKDGRAITAITFDFKLRKGTTNKQSAVSSRRK